MTQYRSFMKLKDMKYEIKGTDSNKPALECLSAILIGMLVPILIAVIVRFASDIDKIIQ